MIGTLAALLCAWPGPIVAVPGSEGLDHEAVARAWLAERKLDPAGKTPPDVVREHFVHLRWGVFDVSFPPGSFSDWGEAYAQSLAGLLRLQEAWLGWIPPQASDEARSSALARIAALHAWAEPLGKSLKKLDAEPGAELLELLDASEEVRSAAAELASYFGSGGPIPREGEPRFVPLVFAPGREDFVPFVSVIGLVDEPWRHEYWSPDVVTWLHCEWGGMRVLALEFATEDASRDWEKSTSMTQENKKALAEHVVQLGARQLFEQLGVPSLFAVALANNITIEIFGEVDTRNDGDTKARKIDEVSVFVPGALSDGVLPAANADSRWRMDKGVKYFVPALRKGQKDGAKEARSKWEKKTHFALEGDEGGKHTVEAPFFGPGSEPPPEDFLADYTEFLRAYRSGFLHWLREAGVDGDAERSRRAFGDLLTRMSGGAELAAALEATYPLPMSAEKLTEKTLEGSFLSWLAEQK
jgi:hypothetical protein